MITKWTTKLRYLPYKDWPAEQIADIKQNINNSHWRLGYHIQPSTGLMNDPNGFSYFNNQWHLFYQSFPYGPVHGLKNWTHLTSKDLVNWQDHGPALLPGDAQDSHGAYSGSGIVVDDKLFLMYTGNVRDKDWVRYPKQDGAWLDKNNHLQKIATPLIDQVKSGFTDHFRDPQIIEHDGQYYCLIGARKKDDTGHVLVYQAPNVTGPWSYKTELKFTDEPMGYMIECPNLVFIDDKPVLIFCPQGISQDVLKHQNIYPNAYVVGEGFDWDKFEFSNPSTIKNLDEGFDVYATQAFNAPDGRVLSISWIGLPDTTYPSDVEGWAHCYSLVKELKLIGGQLYQQPVVENNQLVEATIDSKEISAQTKISAAVSGLEGTIKITTEEAEEIKIIIDAPNGKILVDRTKAGIPFATDFGTTRNAKVTKGIKQLDLYLDNTVFELYVNNGELVFTGRIFPQGKKFFVKSDLPITKQRLKKIY